MKLLKQLSVGWLIILLMLPFIGCSCSGARPDDSPFLFNSSASYCLWDTDGYILINADKPYFFNKHTSVIKPLLLDPLRGYYAEEYDGIVGDINYKILFATRNGAYVLENDYSMLSSGTPSFILLYVGFDGFNVETVLEVHKKRKHNDFLAFEELFSLRGTSAQFYFDDELTSLWDFAAVHEFFVLKGNIYTIESNRVCRYNLSTGQSLVLIENLGPRLEVSCDGEYIYYVSDNFSLCRLSLKTGTTSVIVVEPVEGIYVNSDSVYYKNIADDFNLYRYSKDTGFSALITNFLVNEMQTVGKYLYYVDSDYRLLRMPSDGGDSEVLVDTEVLTFCVDSRNHFIYYQTAERAGEEYINVFYRIDDLGNRKLIDFAQAC
ncbi:MAG: DUF5050 domain-containing protein [Coriobacteriales bacterium]|jgi:hypothetical protein|nr:DUF5050 domain-containing protein [Coriobacteriales bacterium]